MPAGTSSEAPELFPDVPGSGVRGVESNVFLLMVGTPEFLNELFTEIRNGRGDPGHNHVLP